MTKIPTLEESINAAAALWAGAPDVHRYRVSTRFAGAPLTYTILARDMADAVEQTKCWRHRIIVERVS